MTVLSPSGRKRTLILFAVFAAAGAACILLAQRYMDGLGELAKADPALATGRARAALRATFYAMGAALAGIGGYFVHLAYLIVKRLRSLPEALPPEDLPCTPERMRSVAASLVLAAGFMFAGAVAMAFYMPGIF